MKYITKKNPPKVYSDWCKDAERLGNDHYGNVYAKERTPLKQSLINEQGALCAYTMKRIDMNSCHVEHIKPETVCRAEKKGSDLDYGNMVACFPKEDLKHPYRYGAKQKDDWWEEDGKHFVSPLSRRCESVLSFDLKGNVTPVGKNASAEKTIGVLKLNHPTLIDERKRSISEFIYGSDGSSPLSRAKAESAVTDIVQRRGDGLFIEFCIAIRGALIQHIEQLDRIAQKRNMQLKAKNKKTSHE